MAIVALPPRTSIEAAICSAEQRGSGAVAFFGGTLNCLARVSEAVPDDLLPRCAYTAPATASARTPPRTTQMSRVRVTFESTSGKRGKVQPTAAFAQDGYTHRRQIETGATGLEPATST